MIKICGLNNFENINEVVKLKPDFIGLIFYEKSPRYVGNLNSKKIKNLSSISKKVGVFVNEPIDSIKEKVKLYGLDFVQLHGDESPNYCEELKGYNFSLIKAFGIEPCTDFNTIEPFIPYCDLFLFDTHTENFGGSGKQFNWSLLEKYRFETKFLLSGGLDFKAIMKIKEKYHPKLFGFDLNSKLEIRPGVKDLNKTKLCINQIQI